jgi:hypothetical protein
MNRASLKRISIASFAASVGATALVATSNIAMADPPTNCRLAGDCIYYAELGGGLIAELDGLCGIAYSQCACFWSGGSIEDYQVTSQCITEGG